MSKIYWGRLSIKTDSTPEEIASSIRYPHLGRASTVEKPYAYSESREALFQGRHFYALRITQRVLYRNTEQVVFSERGFLDHLSTSERGLSKIIHDLTRSKRLRIENSPSNVTEMVYDLLNRFTDPFSSSEIQTPDQFEVAIWLKSLLNRELIPRSIVEEVKKEIDPFFGEGYLRAVQTLKGDQLLREM